MFHLTIPVTDENIDDPPSPDSDSKTPPIRDEEYAPRVYIKAHKALQRAEFMEKRVLCIGLLYACMVVWFVIFSCF